MEILPKLRDSLAMFWQALDDRERRVIALSAAYACTMIATELSRRQQVKSRARLKAEIVEELRHAR